MMKKNVGYIKRWFVVLLLTALSVYSVIAMPKTSESTISIMAIGDEWASNTFSDKFIKNLRNDISSIYNNTDLSVNKENIYGEEIYLNIAKLAPLILSHQPDIAVLMLGNQPVSPIFCYSKTTSISFWKNKLIELLWPVYEKIVINRIQTDENRAQVVPRRIAYLLFADFIKTTEEKLKRNVEMDMRSFRAYLELAWFYSHKEKLKDAEVVLRDAIVVDRNSYGGYVELGRIYALQGYTDKAIELFRKAIAMYPTYSGARLALARCYMNQRQYENANGIYSRLTEEYPDNAQFQLELALCLLAQREYERARNIVLSLQTKSFIFWGQSYGKQVELTNSSEMIEARAEIIRLVNEEMKIGKTQETATLSLAWLYMVMGNYKKAESMIASDVELSQKTVETMLALSRIYCVTGQYGKSERLLKRAQSIDPQMSLIPVYLGWLLRFEGKYKKAIKVLEKAIQINQNNDRAMIELVWCYLIQGEHEKACALVDRAVGIHRGNFPIYFGLAWWYLAQQEFDRAENILKKAIRLNPKSGECYATMGRACLAQGQLTDAENCFRLAIEKEPNNARAYYTLGRVYVKQGQYTEAEKLFLISMEKDPGRYELYVDYAICLFAQERFDEALIALDKALHIGLSIQHDVAYETMGRIFMATEEYDKALSAFSNALLINTNNPSLYEYRSICFSAKKQMREANENLDEAHRLRMTFYNPYARYQLNVLHNLLAEESIPLVCVQHPLRKVESLKRLFKNRTGLFIFDMSNEIYEQQKISGLSMYLRDVINEEYFTLSSFGRQILRASLLTCPPVKNILEKTLPDNLD